ncbi:polysaccharide deacetylase family protein [uncultured Propionivibrio sp.]|uniref:polysaccharide deacetylase family protein n=1 Tax=uncultured Propionivibrio sp. TaxID=426737 RepID=UPI0029C0AF7F|nr:polysaccharide deacetylase family protein [uncultured Propionivibrio sp.]
MTTDTTHRTAPITTHVAALAFWALLACAALPSLAAPPDASTTAAPRHTREEETAVIREHHFRRLDTRLATEPAILRQTCRYESEISTPPPPGRVALSFDDGPEPGQTDYILDILARQGISGTFFLIGEKSSAHPELTARILASGKHTVGNHSWSHPNFHAIPPEQQREEILRYEEPASPGPVKRLFRYPYGNSSCEANELLHARGYRIVGWHIDSCDWAFDRNGSIDPKEAISCGVLAQNRHNYVEHVVSTVRAHRGGIVLMHEIHPNTLARLEEIIVRLKEEGFLFGAIEDPEFLPSLR